MSSTKLPKQNKGSAQWMLPFIKLGSRESTIEKLKPMPSSTTLARPSVKIDSVHKMIKLSRIYLPPQEHFRVKIFKRKLQQSKPAQAPTVPDAANNNINNNNNDQDEVPEEYSGEPENDCDNDLDDTEPVPATEHDEPAKQAISQCKVEDVRSGDAVDDEAAQGGLYQGNIAESCSDLPNANNDCNSKKSQVDPGKQEGNTVIEEADEGLASQSDVLADRKQDVERTEHIPRVDYEQLCCNMKRLNAQIDILLKKPEDAMFSEATAIEFESGMVSFQDSLDSCIKIPDFKRRGNIRRIMKRNRKVFSIVCKHIHILFFLSYIILFPSPSSYVLLFALLFIIIS